MTFLNPLIVLKDLEWPQQDSHILVAHNFPGFSTPHDFGFAMVDFSKEIKQTVIDRFYLVPVWPYPTFDAKVVYSRVLTSSFSNKPFLRYLIPTTERKEPYLIEEELPATYGAVDYGFVSKDNLKRFEESYLYLESLVKKTEEIINKF